MASFARGNPARWWKSRACGGASRAPLSLFVSPVRRWAGWIALVLMVSVAAGGWYVTRPARISRLAEVLLSRMVGGNVTVRGGRLSFSGTLLLSGVEVRTVPDPGAPPTPADDVPIFSAEQIEARFDWMSLLTGQLTATQLVADSPVFRPIENRDTDHDRWNYELLRPAAMRNPAERRTGSGGPMVLPVVLVRDARVEWGEVHDGQLKVTARGTMAGDFTPDATVPSNYHFEIRHPGGEDLIRGTWDTAAQQFVATAKDLDIADALKNGIPHQVTDWFDEHKVTGRLSEMSMTFDPHDGPSVSAELDGVSMVWMVQPEQGILVGENRNAYPLDLKNVRGRLQFSRNDPVVQISNLRGEALGQPFSADYTMHGASLDAPFELRLRFDGAVLKDPYPPLFMAFITGQDLLERVSPKGKMDIAVDIERKVVRGPLLVNGSIDCHDAKMRFVHFPYPLDHMNGRITFDQESVTFHDVKAKGDDSDVTISGMTGTTWSNRAINFTVNSQNASFDDRMAACLPEKYRAIWDMFTLQAKGAFVCRVTRSNSLFDTPRVVVDVDVKDGSGYLHRVPYAFDGASGHLHFEADQTRIEHLTLHTGKDDSGRVTLDGVVRHPAGDVSHLQPDLNLKMDVPLEARLINALPAEFSDKLRGVAFGGRAGFDGTVRVTADAPAGETQGTLLVNGNVTLDGASVKGRISGMDLAMSNIAAAARVSPEGLEIVRLAGDLGLPEAAVLPANGARAATAAGAQRLRIGVSGKLDRAFAGHLQASAIGTGLALPANLPDFAPDKWKDAWRDFQPAGHLDLFAQATVAVNAPAPAQVPATAAAVRGGNAILPPPRIGPLTIEDYKARLVLQDASLAGKDWPGALAKLHGTVDVAPAGITMQEMTGVMEGADLSWAGQYRPESGAMSLSGEAHLDRLAAGWLAKLPAGISRNLDATRKDTELSLKIDALSRDGNGKPWKFAGKLTASNLAATGPVAMNAGHVTLSGKGTLDLATGKSGGGAGIDFSGALAAQKMSVSGRVMDTLAANITAEAATHAITIGEINGQVAGGQLQGIIHIRTAGDVDPATQPTTSAPDTMPAAGGYRAELTLSDADLAQLVATDSSGGDDHKKIGEGRVNASLSLQETFGPDADRTGRGELTIDNGKIFNVPLSMGLMQIATLRLPVADSFEQASLSYYLRNDQVTFERILLESKGIDLAGMGTLSIKDKSLDLLFATQTPHEVYIPILTPIIQATRDGLLQVSVTGTLANPKIVPVPLSAITLTLRNIFPHEHADASK